MSTTATATPKFDYGVVHVKDIEVKSRQIPSEHGRAPRSVVESVTVNGEPLGASKRFWTSLQCRFGFSHNIFRYFGHAEVFQRISEKCPNDRIRFCVERNNDKNTLLAVTNPVGPHVRYDQLQELLQRNGAEKVAYNNGIVCSTHTPRGAAAAFKIQGDEFKNQFVIDTPIDGFGRPNIYLSLLRLICSNGAIGYTKAFRSELSTGKTDDEIAYALLRAIDGFNNEEGFGAMRDRFNTATNSWASVNEAQKLYRGLASLAGSGDFITKGGPTKIVDGNVVESASPVFHNFHKLTGDLAQKYGMANLEGLSSKRQRMLPAPCKVYDLLNFATEVATHHTKPSGSRKMQAFVGDIISNDYDLENTVDQFSDWQDLFIGHEDTINTMQEMKNKRR